MSSPCADAPGRHHPCEGGVVLTAGKAHLAFGQRQLVPKSVRWANTLPAAMLARHCDVDELRVLAASNLYRRNGADHVTKLDKQFSAQLQKSPTKGGWTYVVMPDSAEFFGTRG